MLGKLMKYEFKATGRVFLPLFAALIIISAVNRLLSAIGLVTPFTIGAVVSGILIAGIFIIVLVLTIQRFRNNLLSDEGHLMMTLPVKTDSLILSKMFVASIWAAASMLVVTISIVIMAAAEISYADVEKFFRYIGSEISGYAVETAFITVESLIFIALASFSNILMLYACLSLSMLVSKRRGLFAFGAFIVISTIMQTLTAIIAAIGAALEINSRWFSNTFGSLSNFGQAQIAILAVLLGLAVICAAFYFTTRYMLKNKLNLQ